MSNNSKVSVLRTLTIKNKPQKSMQKLKATHKTAMVMLTLPTPCKLKCYNILYSLSLSLPPYLSPSHKVQCMHVQYNYACIAIILYAGEAAHINLYHDTLFFYSTCMYSVCMLALDTCWCCTVY